MPVDTLTPDRLFLAALLAVLAVAVAFGPEFGRFIGRVRNRRASDVTPDAPNLGVEPQQS